MPQGSVRRPRDPDPPVSRRTRQATRNSRNGRPFGTPPGGLARGVESIKSTTFREELSARPLVCEAEPSFNARKSPVILALRTVLTMRAPETPPLVPAPHRTLGRGSRFATAIERPQGPDTLSFVSLS